MVSNLNFTLRVNPINHFTTVTCGPREHSTSYERKITGVKHKSIIYGRNLHTSLISCRIFEHFALLPDPVTEFLKLGSALHKQGAILAPKLSGSAFL